MEKKYLSLAAFPSFPLPSVLLCSFLFCSLLFHSLPYTIILPCLPFCSLPFPCLLSRTKDAQWGKCLHCTAKNQCRPQYFQVRPKQILSATLAQTFRFLWFLPSFNVRSPCFLSFELSLTLCLQKLPPSLYSISRWKMIMSHFFLWLQHFSAR